MQILAEIGGSTPSILHPVAVELATRLQHFRMHLQALPAGLRVSALRELDPLHNLLLNRNQIIGEGVLCSLLNSQTPTKNNRFNTRVQKGRQTGLTSFCRLPCSAPGQSIN